MYQISNIYVLAAFGTLGGMLFGFDISSMSAWIGSEQYLEYFDHPDSNKQGGITASMSAGSFVGSIAAGYLCDRLGRRGILKVASVIWIIGAALQCSAQNVVHLIIGRIVSGLAIGITSSQVCVFLAELAPANIRGRIVGMQQWAVDWGILLMYLISYGCSSTIPGPSAFRIAWGIQAIPGLILGISLFFFPESPRWLASKDRWDECIDVLALLHGNGDKESPIVLAELDEVREAAAVAAASKDLGYMGLVGPKMWFRTLIGVSAQVWQQLLGGNVMLYYIVYIFEMAGEGGNAGLTSAIIQYVIFLVTTGGVLPIIDRFGRRPLLIYGAMICCVLHFTVGALMASYGEHVQSVNGNSILKLEITNPAAAKGIISCCYIFVGIYGMTWAPVGWIYASEVFPITYRAKGVGVAAAGNWIFNLALAMFVPPAFTNITWETYMIFGTFCAFISIHVFFFYPETAGKSLEEIEYVFESKVPAWRSAKIGGTFEDRIQAVEQKRGVDGEATHEETSSAPHFEKETAPRDHGSTTHTEMV
ncbi:High-affinity glucose transporter [Cytospora mali]|uniref:High-affinity glucose transporter n=1 Tax=Cytospora mali TaxID=578113 RepID=A0A194VZK2_CYTMA|nr:High-affinity glucose transporter [Valsa mali]